MIIKDIQTMPNHILQITYDNGKIGTFDVNPYLKYEAFKGLKDENSFKQIMNGKYFIEWECGADLSADTIEAHLAES